MQQQQQQRKKQQQLPQVDGKKKRGSR
jgi:hypothetical protein